MNKKTLSILLASSVLATVPMAFSPTLAQEAPSYQVATNMGDLIDVPSNHWAYNAVKVLVAELDIMMPKSNNMFKGDDLMSRYELAVVFDRAIQKMEAVSGKDLKMISSVPDTRMVDLDAKYADVVNTVVNDYGIMQPMPGKRFMGNEPISRYEIAFELYNYFVLIENQGTKPALANRDRVSALSDLPSDHWATKAVSEIVDKYQIMDGYPNNTFQGGKRLTRYETAATVREFIRYVDTYLIPMIVVPTPVPTPKPTPKPTPMPTPMPTAVPKEPFKSFDLRLGGDFKASETGTAATPTGYIYGPNASLDWAPIGGDGWSHLGIDLHGDMMLFDPYITPGLFKANVKGTDGTAGTTTLNSRTTAGGGLIWKIQGSAQDIGLTLGAGYDVVQLAGVDYTYMNHGPRARVDLEIPIGPWFSLVGRGAVTYFISPTAGVTDNMQWKSDAFAGITIPAFTNFSVELGYKDTRYSMVAADGSQFGDFSKIFGDIGGQLNLRFRF